MMKFGQSVDVFRVRMGGPGDVSGLADLFAAGTARPQDVVAIFGKTEGNGGVNDFTREYASRSFARFLAAHLQTSVDEVERRVALIMSGGTEGVLSPHATIFCRRRRQSDPRLGAPRLAVGVAITRDFLPEELGRPPQIAETTAAVRAAMDDAGIDDPADVHFVQVKCPLLTSDRMREAQARGARVVTDDAYASMAYSRGASALGVALALGEIDDVPGTVLDDYSLYSDVASASAGIELMHNAVVVLGNAPTSDSPYRIAHGVMRDAMDMEGARAAFAALDLIAPDGWRIESGRIINVFAKAEPSSDGLVRGFRHTMLNDTDISATRHARAAVGGLLAGLAGCGAIYVSGGAEHQGPSGGGPVAVIAIAADADEKTLG